MAQSLLIMLPALALAIAMLLRPYLGERTIARLRACRARARRAHLTVLVTAASRRSRASVARGGRLIAVAMAGRAPPPAFAGCR